MSPRPITENTLFYDDLDILRLYVFDQGINRIIHQLGRKANLAALTHVLWYTCLTNLVSCGNDLVLMAEVAGHSCTNVAKL